MKSTFNKARTFIYRNARPLDMARWQYHFENGSKEAVLTALADYQNEDGGFGHALEPDLWNPQSTPFSTGKAIDVLIEIDLYDCEHSIIRGILRFLDSRTGFVEKGWLQKMSSNNDAPHAPWWTYCEKRPGGFESDFEYNPTAVLIGFCLRTAPSNTKLWQEARRIAGEALAMIFDRAAIERHELGGYCTLFEDLTAAGLHEIFPLDKLVGMLKVEVTASIEQDTAK